MTADTGCMLDQPLSQRLREIREAQATEAEPEAVPDPPRRLPLGQLLIEKGLVTESDLGLALAHQRADGRPLGQILLAMGVVTEQELARTLTEQHGFDFSTFSLRRRLTPIARPVDEMEAEEVFEPERYILRKPASEEPLHIAESFLDAADAAFELIDERDPDQLEIVRTRDGALEHLWSYSRADADAAPLAS